jgi:hypothetical protein
MLLEDKAEAIRPPGISGFAPPGTGGTLMGGGSLLDPSLFWVDPGQYPD